MNTVAEHIEELNKRGTCIRETGGFDNYACICETCSKKMLNYFEKEFKPLLD